MRCRGPHLPSGVAARAGDDQAISLPLLNGPDLATVEVELIRRSRGLPAAACAWVALALAQALQSLHDSTAVGEALCHGAVNHENVITTLDGDCVLIDLGHCLPATDENRAADIAALGRLVISLLDDRSSDPRPLQRRLHTLAKKLRDQPEAHPITSVVADLARLLERRAELDPRGLLAAELRELFGHLARKGAIWAIPPGPLRPPSVPLALAWPRAGIAPTDRPLNRGGLDSFSTDFAETVVADPVPAPGLDPAPTLRPRAGGLRTDQRRALIVAALVFFVGLVGLRWFFGAGTSTPARVAELEEPAPADSPTLTEPAPATEQPPAVEPAAIAPAATPRPRAAKPERSTEPKPRTTPRPRAEPKPAVAPPPPVATPVPVEPTPEPTIVEAKPEPKPQRKPRAARVKLVVVSEPPGALIAVDRKELGPAPVIASVPPGSFVEIRASMGGYLATHKLHKVGKIDGRFTVRLAPE